MRPAFVPAPRAARLLAGVVAAIPAGAVAATADAEALAGHFTRDWYYTEVIVFQRPAVMEHASDEALVDVPAPQPRHLRSFDTDTALWRQYDLYPLTRAYLAFPYLDQALLAPWREDGEGVAGEDFGDAAARAQQDPSDADGIAPPAIDPRLEPDPLLDFLAELAGFEDGLAERSYRWLPADTFALGGAADRLRRAAGFQVLLHGRWLQPVPPRAAPEALLVEAGPRYGREPALQGTFDVTLGRYLHFHANLYYTEPLLGREPLSPALPPPGEQLGTPLAGVAETGKPPPAGIPQRPEGPASITPPGSGTLTPAMLAPAGYMQLRQSRRLRSEEVHYLDHPKLGILVRIDPVQPPERLSAAFEALEEGEQ